MCGDKVNKTTQKRQTNCTRQRREHVEPTKLTVAEIEGRLPLDIEDGLYRIAQEVLNNMLKHAEAAHVWVRLSQADDLVTLEINDDGRGFEVASAMESGGMGLSGMQERADKMNGHLLIESQPEQGTRIVIEVKI